MRFFISRGDARFDYLKLELALRGHEPTGPENAQVLVFPDEIDERVPVGARAFTYFKSCAGARRLLDCEPLVMENARLTAEGAVVLTAARTPFALIRESALVVGYGRIGAALVETLCAMGVRTFLYSRRDYALRRGAGRGATPVRLAEGLSAARMVFSTSPGGILDAEALSHARRDAQIVELASQPYGTDLEACARLGIAACVESGIPGRYCPESAGRAICEQLIDLIEGKAEDENS